MKKQFTAAIALFTALQFANVQAAAIDNEIAILAADQGEEIKQVEKVEEPVKPVKKTKKELEEEKKRLKEEQKRLKAEKKAAEKKLKEERKAARKQIEEGKKEIVKLDDKKRRTPTTIPRSSTLTNDSKPRTSDNVQRTTNPVTSTNRDSAVNNTTTPRREPVTTVTNNPPTTPINRNSTVTNTTPRKEPVTTANRTTSTSSQSQNVNMPNPMQSYPSFNAVAKAVGFTPLYIPKKSGYTVNEIYTVGNRMAEIRYGRRWEPEVSLHIRTYKRTPGEELKDISGVNNVKWRVDTAGDTTVYVAKITDNTHAAAWAVGDYTFSAYVENLSFAAFHSLVVEELVDLSAHYFVN